MFFENHLNIEIPQVRISQKWPQIGLGGLILSYLITFLVNDNKDIISKK